MRLGQVAAAEFVPGRELKRPSGAWGDCGATTSLAASSPLFATEPMAHGRRGDRAECISRAAGGCLDVAAGANAGR